MISKFLFGYFRRAQGFSNDLIDTKEKIIYWEKWEDKFASISIQPYLNDKVMQISWTASMPSQERIKVFRAFEDNAPR